jgi:hypothetical protein
MNFTNTHKLPESLVSAISHRGEYAYQARGDISVTSLIGPPRIRVLKMRHAGQITEDVSDRIWALLGSGVHYILERAETRNALQEEQLEMDVAGWTLTGTADLWEEPGTLSDYKVTSVWSYIGGVKPEWEAQLNVYAQMYRLRGFPVGQIQVIAIFRDWQKNKAKAGLDYPQCAVGVMPVMMWPDTEVMEYIHDRIRLHQQSEQMYADALPVCTPEERWERPTTYAVMKKKQKRAVRVLESMESAQAWLDEGKGDIIHVRPGASVRCMDYCPVNQFCNFYKSMEVTTDEI